MDSYKYNQVDQLNEDIQQEESSWKPFFRQLLVCSGLWTTYFVTGLCFGAPTVVIPQLRRNTTVSDEMASWLSSAMSYSAMPWVIILPALSSYIGRKPPFYFAICTSICSLIIFYFANTSTHFLISQIVQGILFGSNLTISVIMVTEYTSPKYRGIFLCIKSASLFWGMWVSNAIGTFFNWNYIGMFGLLCSTHYLTVFIWPESPHWLATKGRFDECIKAHRWLKGVDRHSEDELSKLINSQKEQINNINNNISKNLWQTIKLREFHMPIIMSVLVMAQLQSSGKLVCGIYSIDLISKITESESTAYAGMLILDGASVLGMYFGSILSKFLTRRFMLIFFTCLGVFFLFSLSFYLWLVEFSYVKENKILSIFFLSAFSISISCGPMIMSTSIYSELIPLKYKSSGVIITILFHFLLTGTSIKIAPLVFKSLGLYGTFLLYGIMVSVLTIILYKYLPETKDKTLQDIELYFKDGVKVNNEKEKVEEVISLAKK